MMGFYRLNEVSETSVGSFLMDGTNILVNRKKGLKQVIALLGAARKSLITKTSDGFNIHFIFGLPMSLFTETFVSFISERLIKSSTFYYTALSGRKIHQVNKSQTTSGQSFRGQDALTIGDDIESMYDQLKTYKDNGFYKSKSVSTFLEADETLTQIKCKRKSYTSKAKSKKTFRLSICRVSCILLIFWGLLAYKIWDEIGKNSLSIDTVQYIFLSSMVLSALSSCFFLVFFISGHVMTSVFLKFNIIFNLLLIVMALLVLISLAIHTFFILSFRSFFQYIFPLLILSSLWVLFYLLFLFFLL